MRPYKKTIVICLIVALASGIGMYCISKDMRESILSGIFTGAIISIITTSVLYSVKKDEIFTNIGKELISTYWRLSYMYSQLIKCANKLKNNEKYQSVVYKEILSIYKIYDKYMQENHFDFALNNYDGLLFNNWITRFFVSKEVRILVDINDAHKINNQYALLSGNLSLMRIELDLAEKEENIEKINSLLKQVDTQYNYSLNTIPQQLAFINYAMQHFEQVRKLSDLWCEIKQDILNRNELFDNQINNAEHNLQEECDKYRKLKDKK